MKAWGMSHVGMARKLNEDSFLICMSADRQGGYFIVCDGMGGAKAGDVASRLATDTFASHFDPAVPCPRLEECVKSAMQNANARVWEMSHSDPMLDGMGTTMVCMVMQDGEAVIGNVGDSRAYLIDDEGIRQITRDHSLVGEMLTRGELTPYEAQHHPSRNVITRAIGVDREIRCDTFALRPKAGQYVLLCSDGLTDMVSMEDLKAVLSGGVSPQEMAKELVRLALAGGGRDNVTVIVLQIREKEPVWRRLFGRAGSKEAKG